MAQVQATDTSPPTPQTGELNKSNGSANTSAPATDTSPPATDATAPPADVIPFDQKEERKTKASLDLAWGKIEKGLAQEAEGRKLWVEGTLELINILNDARKRFPADQEFGTWLTNNGYGEDRITRHQRAALLNMAEHLDLAREVLEQTHRLSWRRIWEEEIQPRRLPSPGQPADGKGPDAPDGKGPEAPDGKEPKPKARTRRPRNKSGGARPSWSFDRNRFSEDALRIANEAIALKRCVFESTSEALRKLQDEADTVLLERLTEASKALADARVRLDGSLEEEADTLIQQGRITTTPARASAPIQPSRQ
jgi:hypothetical protein